MQTSNLSKPHLHVFINKTGHAPVWRLDIIICVCDSRVFHLSVVMFATQVGCKACNMSAGNSQLIFLSCRLVTNAATKPLLFLLQEMRAHFYHFLGHQRVCICDVFPSSFPAKRSLCSGCVWICTKDAFLSRITHAHFRKQVMSLHAVRNRSKSQTTTFFRPVYA